LFHFAVETIGAAELERNPDLSEEELKKLVIFRLHGIRV